MTLLLDYCHIIKLDPSWQFFQIVICWSQIHVNIFHHHIIMYMEACLSCSYFLIVLGSFIIIAQFSYFNYFVHTFSSFVLYGFFTFLKRCFVSVQCVCYRAIPSIVVMVLGLFKSSSSYDELVKFYQLCCLCEGLNMQCIYF